MSKFISRLMLLSLLFNSIFFTSIAYGNNIEITTENLPIGSYVKFGSYMDEPILWMVINNDENGTVIFSDKIIDLKGFDSAGANLDNGQN